MENNNYTFQTVFLNEALSSKKKIGFCFDVLCVKFYNWIRTFVVIYVNKMKFAFDLMQ